MQPLTRYRFNPGDVVTATIEEVPGVSVPMGVRLDWGNGDSQTVILLPNSQTVQHTLTSDWFYFSAQGSWITIGASFHVTLTCTPAQIEFANATPASGRPGDEVVITGSGFHDVSKVLFGEVEVTPVIQNSTEMVVTVPAGVGAVPLTLVNHGQVETSTAFNYTYVGATEPLMITSPAPEGARVGGGYTITTSEDASGQVELSVLPESAEICALQGHEVSFIGVGRCTISASAPGESGQTDRKATQAFQIDKALTTLSIDSTPSGTVPPSQPVDLTARLTSPNTGASGTVSFMRDAQALQGCEAVPLRESVAQCTADLGAGTHSITAQYSGDANSEPSESQALTVTVSESAVQPPDPVQPNPTQAPHAVPTLSPWNLAFLASAMFASLGFLRGHRRSRSSS